MKCSKCEHQNPAEAKFCELCGASLGRVCAKCGNSVSTVAKFCSQCGHPLAADNERFVSPKDYTPQHIADKILTSQVAVEGERKQVTVLFADIRGSMELLANRDVEAAQKLMDPVLERMIEAVHRYEGTVNRVMGDGIMALFGAPIAHEDHAVRACYAALRMQETVKQYAEKVQQSHGLAVAIRVGLNSGEIVVCAIGNDLHVDYTVVGQTANVAARLQQMATPGAVLTTHDTFRLVEGYVAMKSLGPMPVKGLADLVEVYEVTGAGAARTRIQVSAGRGLTRFVGRDVDLERLRRVQQLARSGRGQVVAIIGEAGVGKSRLVHEFAYSQQATDWLIMESKSVSYGRATPYLPVIELLKDYCRINADDRRQSIREKVSARFSALDASLHDAIPPVLDLFDALDEDDRFRSLDAAQRRRQTYNAVIRLLLSESRRQPVIVVFEDLHWYDQLSLGLLNELAVSLQNAPLLLIVSYRPEYHDDWRSRPNYGRIRLDPFVTERLEEFLRALLGCDRNLSSIRSFLVEHAGGNPFFIEEIVRQLVDTGVLTGARGSYALARPFARTEVPPTVRAVLAARIDALPAVAKHVLEDAAVIGYHVPFALLRSICRLAEDELRALLDNLQDAEFLYSTQLYPDVAYAFNHALTHDVAYNGVLHERRREVHARVMDAIEKLYGDRLGEQTERLAHHAVRGELHEKAVHYLRQAGLKAAARAALAEARVCFEQALSILKVLPESEASLEKAFEIRVELRPVLRQLGDGREMLKHLNEAEVLAERLKDDRRLGLVCALKTTVHSTLDELDEALVTGTRALEIARRLGDLKLRILTTSHLEQSYYYRGEYEKVAELATDNLAALPTDWVREHFDMAVPASVVSRGWLIMSLAELGRFVEAAECEAETIQIAEETQHAYTIGWAHFAASMPHLLKGDWEKARALVTRWIAMLRTGNVAIHLPWAVASSAWVLAQIGDGREALNQVQEGEQLLERQAANGIVGHRGWAYHALGRASLVLGRLDEARRLGDRAVKSSQRQPGFAAHALHLLGDIATNSERYDFERGEAHYRKALVLARLHGMRPLIAHCHLGLGKLYRGTGKPEDAHENLTLATSMYRELDMASDFGKGD